MENTGSAECSDNKKETSEFAVKEENHEIKQPDSITTEESPSFERATKGNNFSTHLPTFVVRNRTVEDILPSLTSETSGMCNDLSDITHDHERKDGNADDISSTLKSNHSNIKEGDSSDAKSPFLRNDMKSDGMIEKSKFERMQTAFSEILNCNTESHMDGGKTLLPRDSIGNTNSAEDMMWKCRSKDRGGSPTYITSLAARNNETIQNKLSSPPSSTKLKKGAEAFISKDPEHNTPSVTEIVSYKPEQYLLDPSLVSLSETIIDCKDLVQDCLNNVEGKVDFNQFHRDNKVLQVYWTLVQQNAEGRDSTEDTESKMSNQELETEPSKEKCPEPQNPCKTTEGGYCKKLCPGEISRSRTNACEPALGKDSCQREDAVECKKCDISSENNYHTSETSSFDSMSEGSEVSCYPLPGKGQCTAMTCQACPENVESTDNVEPKEPDVVVGPPEPEEKSGKKYPSETDVKSEIERPTDTEEEPGPVYPTESEERPQEVHPEEADEKVEYQLPEEPVEQIGDQYPGDECAMKQQDSDMPCQRIDCPGKDTYAAVTVSSHRCVPGPGMTKCDAQMGQKCEECFAPIKQEVKKDRCIPGSGKTKCDESSPMACDQCDLDTHWKLFDNDIVCRPKTGESACDPAASIYCIQCVQMIQPGLHDAPQLETIIKCYESYKKECVVCAASKKGYTPPLNAPICTPQLDKKFFQEIQGVECEECLMEALANEDLMETTQQTKTQKSHGDMSTVAIEEYVGATEPSHEQPPSKTPMDASRECFPQPGMDSCDAETAKMCAECMRQDQYPPGEPPQTESNMTYPSKCPSRLTEPPSHTGQSDRSLAPKSDHQTPASSYHSPNPSAREGPSQCHVPTGKEHCEADLHICNECHTMNANKSSEMKIASCAREECPTQETPTNTVPADKSDYSVIRCDPNPGELYCSTERAETCGCYTRWLEENDLKAPSPQQPTCGPSSQSVIKCSAPPGQDRCHPEEATVCQVCKKTSEPPDALSATHSQGPPQASESVIRCSPDPQTNICNPESQLCEICGKAVETENQGTQTECSRMDCPTKVPSQKTATPVPSHHSEKKARMPCGPNNLKNCKCPDEETRVVDYPSKQEVASSHKEIAPEPMDCRLYPGSDLCGTSTMICDQCNEPIAYTTSARQEPVQQGPGNSSTQCGTCHSK